MWASASRAHCAGHGQRRGFGAALAGSAAGGRELAPREPGRLPVSAERAGELGDERDIGAEAASSARGAGLARRDGCESSARTWITPAATSTSSQTSSEMRKPV